MIDGQKVTAKIKVTRIRNEFESQYKTLEFGPDYEDNRNREWAYATPSLSLQMNVIPNIADLFDENERFTLTLTPERSEDEKHTES